MKHVLFVALMGAALAGCERAPTPRVAPAVAPAPPPVVPASNRDRPALDIATLDGTRYTLAAHRGRWVVVNFWATWCAPCLKEMPELSALHSMREDVEVVGLAFEDITPEDMRAFLAKRPVTYPVAIVDVAEPPADFEVPRGLPMTVLIAPDGRVAKRTLGPVTAASLEAAIAGAK